MELCQYKLRMALFTLGRPFCLGLVAASALDVEGVVLLGAGRITRGGRIFAVTLKTALDLIFVSSLVMALETIDRLTVLGVVKSRTRFFISGFVDGYHIPGDNHGCCKHHCYSKSGEHNDHFSTHVVLLLIQELVARAAIN